MQRNLTTAPAPIFEPKPDQLMLAASIADLLNASRKQQPKPEQSITEPSAAAQWRAAELSWQRGAA